MLKRNQLGRSMVEMLGVLAIIGVLSVGGIAGYRYAMIQHKVNQLFEDIELERVYAMEEMNKENPTGYVSETQNSGDFTIEFGCGVIGYNGKCIRLQFEINNTEMCKQFIKRAPENWIYLRAGYPTRYISLKTFDCSTNQIYLGFYDYLNNLY